MVIFHYYIILIFVIELVTAFFAVRLTRKTKHNMAWIVMTVGFVITSFVTVLYFFGSLMVESQDLFFQLVFLVKGFAVSLTLIGVILIKRIFKYIEKAENERKEMDKKLLTTIIQTEEEERLRVAKDLHDGLGPLISTIRLSISSLMKNEHDQKTQDILSNTSKLVQDALKTIKEISNNISPHILTNFGLEKAINHFIDQVNESSLLHIGMVSNLNELRFSPTIEIILYRVISELINNTLKHASASQAMIDLRFKNEKIYVVYTDNGIGLELNKLSSNKSGMGLSNIYSRIKSVNGEIEIHSKKEEGIIVNIIIPTLINDEYNAFYNKKLQQVITPRQKNKK